MQQFKESTDPRPVPIRRYVSIPRENLFPTTGTGPCHTPGSPELIPRSPICFEEYMNVYMALFRNTEKVSKVCLKTMIKSCENDVFTFFEHLCYASNMLL